VPPILSQVHGNPVRSALFCQHGCMNRIRFVGQASLTNRGDVVNVDSQQWHGLIPWYGVR
jgi:hypothetical protein